jgi:hypothetical protein
MQAAFAEGAFYGQRSAVGVGQLGPRVPDTGADTKVVLKSGLGGARIVLVCR